MVYTKKRESHRFEPIEKYAFDGRPAMNLAPTLDSYHPVAKETRRLVDRHRASYLCLPKGWGVRIIMLVQFRVNLH
jgi:hypothetical protein